jgi:uncharacterized protein YkwD
MTGYWRILGLATVLALLSGGCPLGSFPDGTNPGGGSASTSGGGSSTSGGGATQGGQSAGDELAAQFPGCSEPAEGDEWRAEILRLVNVERERVGLSPVTRNQTLEDQATQYACEMIYYDFFDHENPVTGTGLGDRAEEFGYDYFMIGENIAAGQSTPAQVMADWMGSPGHRANILQEQFTELGVGVRASENSKWNYWVQEFGRPRNP